MKHAFKTLYTIWAIIVACVVIALSYLLVGFGGAIIAKITQGFYHALNEMTVMFCSLIVGIIFWFMRLEINIKRIERRLK